VPRDRQPDANDIPSTYVPARNTIFLSFALGWAETLGRHGSRSSASMLWTIRVIPIAGPSSWPRSRRLANLATRAGVEGVRFRVHTPLIDLSKADIIRRGLALGVDYGPDPQLLRSGREWRAVRAL
jgi:7-cyano-7-deazaguanine synthase